MPFQRIAVLGSNSFSGATFVRHVLEHTDATVLGISRSREPAAPLLAYRYRFEPGDGFSFLQLDLNTQLHRVLYALDEFEPDLVVNYAAQGEVRNSWRWPEQWYRTNCLAVVGLADHLKEQRYLKRYVAISTPEVYGSTSPELRETNSEFSPSTPYAASKLAGDLYLLTLHKRFGFPAVFVRSANVYGAHQQLYRIIPRTVLYLKMGRKLTLHGGGKARRAFLHMRDAAAGTLLAADKGAPGEAYHLAPEREVVTIADLVRSICDAQGASFEAFTESTEENFGQDAMYSLNADRARVELGWKPAVSLDEGIAEVVDWVEDCWEFLRHQPLDYVHKA